MNEGSQTITLGYTDTQYYQCDLELLILLTPSPKCSDCRDSWLLGKHSYKLSYIPSYVA